MDALLAHWQVLLVAVAMMALDMLTGFAGAAKAGEIMSGKMREGLWHKAGFFGLVALAFVYEVAASLINLEAGSSGIGIAMPEMPAVGAVCAFIIATEAVSILENLCELNPDIAHLPVVRSLKPHDPDATDIDVRVEGRE